MRTIKFRAWINDIKRMDYLEESASLGFVTNNPYGYPIMQFIGLKDKNGKEIYEKDVAAPMSNDFQPKYKGNWIIDFEDGTFVAKRKDGNYNQWLPYWSYDIFAVEIIGNIYENPELIESK